MSRSPATKETTMPVGKAKASAGDGVEPGFEFTVPCFTDLNEAWIKDHLERDHFFWLDLTSPTHEQLRKLQELFGLHPLALEDSEEFHQRPKLDNYGDYVLLVFYGARGDHPDDPLREVHLFISGKYMITIHRD